MENVLPGEKAAWDAARSARRWPHKAITRGDFLLRYDESHAISPSRAGSSFLPAAFAAAIRRGCKHRNSE